MVEFCINFFRAIKTEDDGSYVEGMKIHTVTKPENAPNENSSISIVKLSMILEEVIVFFSTFSDVYTTRIAYLFKLSPIRKKYWILLLLCPVLVTLAP